MSSTIDILKKVGVFILFAGAGISLFPLFGYVYAFISSAYDITTILQPSCSTVTIVKSLTIGSITFLLGTFVYTKWLN